MKGIYLITNTVNKKKYVGLSNNINRRFMEHKTPKNVKNKTTVLSRAFRKYSVDNFTFEILEFVDNIDTLAEREMFWIKKLNPEYNMNDGGVGNKGHALNDEVKQVLRVAGKLQWQSMSSEQKQRVIKYNLKGQQLGHNVSDATRNKLKMANIGKKQSEETIKKRADKLRVKLIGNKNGNKPVIMILDNMAVGYFISIVEAAKSIGVHPSGITSVLKGRQKYCGGFKWKYA